MGELSGKPEESPVVKEKIREFCYELALALRRITGKVVEVDLPPSILPEEKPVPSPDGSDDGHNP